MGLMIAEWYCLYGMQIKDSWLHPGSHLFVAVETHSHLVRRSGPLIPSVWAGGLGGWLGGVVGEQEGTGFFVNGSL